MIDERSIIMIITSGITKINHFLENQKKLFN